MRRFFLELFIFLFGFLIGFGELLYLYSIDSEYLLDRNIIQYIDDIIQKSGNDFMKMMPWWRYALVVIIVLLMIEIIFTEFLRIFANSKSLKGLAVILYIVITLIVAVPFARFIMIYIDGIFMNSDFAIFASVRGVAFSILLRFQIHAFGFTYYKMLKKPVRNCMVILCEATSATSYEIKQALTKRMTFDQCFNFIRNYVDNIEPRQYFRIQEKGFMGIGNVAYWNYYRDGMPMECSEEKFLNKMYNLNQNKSLKLKPEEDKNE